MLFDGVLQLLEGLSDYGSGLDVCERALDDRPGLSACHFLADYLTLHFERQVSPARRQHIHALHLGSKVGEGTQGTAAAAAMCLECYPKLKFMLFILFIDSLLFPYKQV